MALTDRLFEARDTEVFATNPGDPGRGVIVSDFFDRGSFTASGKRVDEKTAKKFPAVYQAIQLIAAKIMTLPLKLYERQPDGGKVEVLDHPLSQVVRHAPNPRMPIQAFLETLQGHLLTRGNAYAEIVTNGMNRVTRLWPLNPARTSLTTDREGNLAYETKAGGETRIIPFSDVLHVPGLGFDGMRGWSPIKLGAEAIGRGMSAQEFQSRFYQNSATPSGLLVHPEELSKDAAQRLQTQWERAHSGLENAHRVAVLDEGIEWQSIGLSPEDSQLIQSEEMSIRDVARIYNIQPHKLRDINAGEPNSMTEQNLEFMEDTIQPWVSRWEGWAGLKLLNQADRERGLFLEFVMDARMRAAPEERAEMISVRVNNGTWTLNDVRKMENENPYEIPQADEPMVQMQMVPVSQIGELSAAERAMLKAEDPEAVKALAELRRVEIENGKPEEPDEGRQAPRNVERRNVNQRRHLVNVFRPLLSDAIRRLTRAEIQEIRSTVPQLFAEDGPEAVLDFLDELYADQVPRMIADQVAPTMRSYAEAVRQVAADTIDADPDVLDLEAWMDGGEDGYIPVFQRRYAASSRKQLASLVLDAEETQEAREAVDQRLDEWEEGTDEGPPRHEKWGQGEANREGNAVAKATFAAGGVTVLRWQTVGTSCPFCRALDGQVVDVTGAFLREGDELDPDEADAPLVPNHDVSHPPVHAGCNCVIMPG